MHMGACVYLYTFTVMKCRALGKRQETTANRPWIGLDAEQAHMEKG